MGLNYNAAVNISAKFTGQAAMKQAADGFNRLNTAIKGLAVALLARETVQFAKQVIDMGDSLNDLRQKTGIGVQALSSLKGAAEDSGLSFEGLEGALKKFSVKVTEAAAGTSTAAAPFRALGLSLKDATGQLKPSGELILQVADKFKALEDGPAKAALAVKLFGKTGADLIPLLNQGRDAIEGFGLQISDDFAARADQFNDTLGAMRRNSEQFAIDGLGKMLPAIQEVVDAFVEFTKVTGDGYGIFEGIGEGIRLTGLAIGNLATYFVEGLDVIIWAFRKAGEDIAFIGANISDGFGTLGEQAVAAAKLNFDEVSRLEDEYEKRKLERKAQHDAEYERLDGGLVQRTEARLKKLHSFNEALTKNSLVFGEGTTAEILARQRAATAPPPLRSGGSVAPALPEDKRAKELESEREKIQRFSESQREALDLRKLELQQAVMSEAQYKRLTTARRLDADALKLSVGMTAENKAQVMELTEAFKQQSDALIALEEKQRASFGRGAQEAFHDYMERARDVSGQTKMMFLNAFSGMEDAIVNFVQTGKLSFADLARSIEADLIRLAIRQAIVFGVASAFGGGGGGTPYSGGSAAHMNFAANGGIIGPEGHMPLRKYARGGVVNTPQVAVFGEGDRPEAFVPLPDGRSIPVTLEGSGGGTSVVVNVNIHQGGASDEGATSDSEKGKQLGRAISMAVKQELLNQRRPGGILS